MLRSLCLFTIRCKTDKEFTFAALHLSTHMFLRANLHPFLERSG